MGITYRCTTAARRSSRLRTRRLAMGGSDSGQAPDRQPALTVPMPDLSDVRSVMVKRVGESRLYDIQVPANEPAQSLATMLANRLGWSDKQLTDGQDYDVEALPPGRILRPDETLADA